MKIENKYIVLETEAYLEKETKEKFYPFYELEYNQWIVYEDDYPKYYFELVEDTNNIVVNDLILKVKEGHDLADLIVEMGKKRNKSWSIHSSKVGKEIEDSFNNEVLKLENLKIVD